MTRKDEYCHSCKTKTEYVYHRRGKYCTSCGVVIQKKSPHHLTLKQAIFFVVVFCFAFYGFFALLFEILSWIGVLK